MLFDNEDSEEDSSEEVTLNVPENSKSESEPQGSLEEEVEEKIIDKDKQMLPGDHETGNKKSDKISLEDIHEQNEKIINLLKEIKDDGENTDELL